MALREFIRLTTSHQDRPAPEDIDLQTLGRSIWRAKGWIVGLAAGAGIATFIILSMLRPLYTSEARILIQNDELSFTRPASDQNRDWQQRALDEQAVQSQVQVLSSRDLAVQVINDLNLTDNAHFLRDAGTGPIRRLLNMLGLGRGSEEERAANAFAENLSVFQLFKSSVIAVEYTSGDSTLAAEIANKLADVYIAWQREAKLEQTKDATAWLSAQIEVLRKRVAEAEAAAEQFRAQQGLFAGTNNVTLNAQQLSELNSQLILAKAQQSEAEARARLIKKMLADKGDIDATPEVLKSEMIARLIDQRVQVARQLAELSATLLPSHPRIKQLQSELADVRAQIRSEALNIVKSLENESQIAAAREASLRNSLNDVKTQASGLSEAEIKLRALEREAKAQRELLESYLVRYRDASARHDMGAVPAQATIVSRAHASILPSFPKRGPLSLLVAVATALLALSYVLARELIGAPSVAAAPAPAATTESRLRIRRRRPAEPEVAPAAATATASAAPGQKSAPAAGKQPQAAPAASAPPAVIILPPPAPVATQPAPVTSAPPAPEPKPEPKIAAEAKSATTQPELPLATAAVATSAAGVEKTEVEKKSWLSKRASFLQPSGVKTKQVEAESEVSTRKADKLPEVTPPKGAPDAPQSQSAAGFLERLRRGLSSNGSEPEAAPAPAEGWLGRIHRHRPAQEKKKAELTEEAPPLPIGGNLPVRTNDLRAYLNQRLAQAAESINDPVRKEKPAAPKSESEKVGPVLKSLDAVINHLIAAGRGGAPRALLVAGVTSKVDATREAISIARALIEKGEQVVLIDIARGATVVSGPLGLPRAPGLTDLTASRSSFGDVVRVDAETPLQVIAAGNPKLASGGDENERFTRVFDALMQAYECVVLHADREALRKLAPALKFELPVVVAVLPSGASADGSKGDLADFSALGCPVLLYEQGGTEPRSRLFKRVAAV
jgi:uncharacterized protein involved in exopolysaccharide biosynthesis